MAILQEFNQGGNKSCISRFSHPLYSHCVCLLSVSTYSSYGLKWEDDPSPHSRSSAWRWETKQNIWTKEKCLPVISQPSLPLLSWAVREWGLMKEGEKVKKTALMSMCLVIGEDHWEAAVIFFVSDITQCPPRSRKPIVFPSSPIHSLPRQPASAPRPDFIFDGGVKKIRFSSPALDLVKHAKVVQAVLL